jgi:hypothetical protein
MTSLRGPFDRLSAARQAFEVDHATGDGACVVDRFNAPQRWNDLVWSVTPVIGVTTGMRWMAVTMPFSSCLNTADRERGCPVGGVLNAGSSSPLPMPMTSKGRD